MKTSDFATCLKTFRLRQIQDQSRVVQNTVIRKLGGGSGREIKTLHILHVDSNWRPGAQALPVAWLGNVIDVWNSALTSATLDDGLNVSDTFRWELDAKSVTVEFKGSTLKITGSMLEVQ